MIRNKICLFILFFHYLVFSQCVECPFAIPKVAVFDFKGTGNIEKDLCATISEFIRTELLSCKNYEIIPKSIMIDSLGEDLVVTEINKAIEYSKKLDACYAVTGYVSALGKKIIISVYLIDVFTKKIVFTDRLTSATIEDIDIICKRLADALCYQKSAKEIVTVETITEEEAKVPRRRQTFGTGGMSLGYFFPAFNSFGENVAQLGGFGFVYFYETTNFMLEAFYGGYSDNNANALQLKFSGYKFLSSKDFAPFVGAGVGRSWGNYVIGVKVDTTYWVRGNGDTVWYYYQYPIIKSFEGLTFELGLGYMLLRTFDVHFFIDLKYNLIFADNKILSGLGVNFGLVYKGMQGCCSF